MNILVVGLGSMGRRRVRLLKKINENFCIIGIDSQNDRRKQTEVEYGIKTYNDLQEAINNERPECVIISTSPLSHADIIETCLNNKLHVFTELNLVTNKYDTNIELAKKNNRVLFLSSTFLYKKEVKYLAYKLQGGNFNYTYHVGQYLPDWHPWETINNYFVGKKETNGCRELFAIELPWLIKVFGNIKSYTKLSSKNTKLNIDYNDNYMLLIEHENGNKGTFVIDVVARKPIRNFEVYNENTYITWDGSPTGLKEFDINIKENKVINLYNEIDKQSGYADFVVENAYRNELETFLGLVKNGGIAEYGFVEDKKVLKLIDEIEG